MPTRARRGFSLLEVMVAMILLIVAAMAISSYTLTVGKTRALSRQQAYSLIAAQEAIDSVRMLGFDNATTGVTSRVSTVGNIPLTVQTTVVQTQTTMKVVDISVANSKGKLLQRFITSMYDETW